MTKEYTLARAQWLKVLLKLISATDNERDELFREAELLFAHMKRQESMSQGCK